MSLHLDSGFESDTPAEWLPWSRHVVAQAALAAVVLVDAVAFVIPQIALVPELWRETAELEGRQRTARLVTAAAHDAHRGEVRSQLNPRDLLPTVSALARHGDVQIVAVKQSVVDKEGAARRIHLQAHGAFARIVAFIDAVAVVIPFGQVEDMALRRLAMSSGQDAGIELEYVLSVPSVDGRKATSAESFESRTR